LDAHPENLARVPAIEAVHDVFAIGCPSIARVIVERILDPFDHSLFGPWLNIRDGGGKFGFSQL